MKLHNVAPSYNQLTLHGSKAAGEEADTIARAIMTRGGLAPWRAVALFSDIRGEDMWGMLTAPRCGSTLPPDDDATMPSISEDELKKLKVEKLCFALALYTDTADNRRKVAESMFAALSKGGNVTVDWFNRRFANFQKNVAFAGMAPPNTHGLAMYAAKYLPSRVTDIKYCEVLRMNYASFAKDEFPEGMWLIQQAPRMNCAPLSAIADTTTEGNYSFEVIANMFGMEAELLTVCSAMWTLIHNPFRHIRKPTLALRTYATVVFRNQICSCIQQYCLRSY